MKYLILALLLIVTDPLEIAKINSLKNEANAAFKSANYQLATEKYSILADSMGVREDEILLNLAHSFYHLGDTGSAKQNYQSVTTSDNKKLKSIASQQLGVMEKDAQKLEESLNYLKNAIKSDPTNSGAKYDYEVVKKLLDQQQEQNQENQDKDQDQENQDKEDQEKKDQEKSEEEKDGEKSEEEKSEEGEKSEEEKEGEKSEEEKEQEGEKSEEEKEQEGEKSEEEKKKEMDESTKQKLQEMNISEEKARMILEALKNNEIQYLQQQKRQPTKQKDSGKPDW